MKKISEILEEIIKKNNLQDEFLLEQIKEIWQEVFPKILTQHVKVIRYIDEHESLVLFSDSSAWKHEILLRQKEIVEKINIKLKIKNLQKQILKIEI